MRFRLIVPTLLALSVASAEALTVAPVPFRDLVARADAVVYGRVSAVEGQWTSDRQRIESLVTVEVIERYKGGGGSTVVFRTPGGRAGAFVNVMPGTPTFRDGDLVVLFLAARGPAIPVVVGVTQGVLPARVDARTGSVLVPAPLGFGAESGPIVRGGAARAPIPLTRLAQAVRALSGSGR